MRRIMVALAALTFLASACTPEQIATLGITNPHTVQVLSDLPDVAVPLEDGTVLELDGSITSAQAVAERLGVVPEVAVGEPPVPIYDENGNPVGGLIPPANEQAGRGLNGMPFAPAGYNNEQKFKFYRAQAGLPASFDRIGWRESNWRNTVRNSCCFGALQQHQGNWRGTSYVRRWNNECDAYSIWDIYGDEPITWQKHMCTAKVMYDISGTQPWSQTR